MLVIMEMAHEDLMRPAEGASTRKVTRMFDELCRCLLCRLIVSRFAHKSDELFAVFAEPGLERHSPFLLVNALPVRVRRQRAVGSTTVMIAVGISQKGYREILGLKVCFCETGEVWRALFADLKASEVCSVDLITSCAHEGLRGAIQRCFPGTILQRCQAHFHRKVTDCLSAANKQRVHQVLETSWRHPALRMRVSRWNRSPQRFRRMCQLPLRCSRMGLSTHHAPIAFCEVPQASSHHKHGRTPYREDPATREGRSYLSKHAAGLAADRGPMHRAKRGVGPRPKVSHHGSLLRM